MYYKRHDLNNLFLLSTHLSIIMTKFTLVTLVDI